MRLAVVWGLEEGLLVVFSEVGGGGTEAHVSRHRASATDSGHHGSQTLGFPSSRALQSGCWKKTVRLPQSWGFAGPFGRRTQMASELVGRGGGELQGEARQGRRLPSRVPEQVQ